MQFVLLHMYDLIHLLVTAVWFAIPVGCRFQFRDYRLVGRSASEKVWFWCSLCVMFREEGNPGLPRPTKNFGGKLVQKLGWRMKVSWSGGVCVVLGGRKNPGLAR